MGRACDPAVQGGAEEMQHSSACSLQVKLPELSQAPSAVMVLLLEEERGRSSIHPPMAAA